MSELTVALPVAGPDAVGRSVRGLVARFRGRLAAIVAVHAAGVACGLLPPLILGDIVGRVADGRRLDLLGSVSSIVAALLAGAVLAFLAAKWSFTLGERIFSVLRMEFLTGLLGMPLRTVERADAGEVLSRSTSDMDALQEVTRTGVPETLVGSVTTAMTLGWAFVLNPVLAVGCLVGIPPIVIATRWYVRRATPAYADELAARAAVSSRVTETVRGHEAVETLRLGPVRKRAIECAIDHSVDTARVPIRLEQRWFPAVQVGYHLPLRAGGAWGAWLLRTGHAEIGEVTAIALYMRAILTPLDDLIYWFGEAQSAKAALARILGVASPSPSPSPSPSLSPSPHSEASRGRPTSRLPSSPSPSSPSPSSPSLPSPSLPLPSPTVPATRADEGADVRLRQVGFSYVDGVRVLHGIDLTVRAGERVCVVGTSGAGKTTLALLLAGVLTPTSGDIRVTGADPAADCAAGPAVDTRPDVVLMAQEDHVFSGTVSDNLTLVRTDAAEPELWGALEAVGAAGWVRALDGALHASLGADAYTPTPGQTRQLALARLLLRKPRVLILDEATAGLSEEESERFATLLPSALRDTTVLQVAHDLWAARRSDRVVVLDDGRIVENGQHSELLAADGTYARLWHAWRAASVGAEER